MPIVVIADTTQGLKEALDDVFAPFGGVRQALPPGGGTLYVKPNAIHFTPHTHTDPRVLEALLGYLRDHGYTRLAVMESCTGGNFTRLVFNRTGEACPEQPALRRSPSVTSASSVEPSRGAAEGTTATPT